MPWSRRIYDRKGSIWYHKKNIINGYSVESVYDYHSGYYYFNVIINNNIYCSLSDNLTFTREKECMAACEKFCEDNV